MFYILCLIVSIIISSCSCSPVVEEAAPLKITEVGSTYYNDSSVWFEIYNISRGNLVKDTNDNERLWTNLKLYNGNKEIILETGEAHTIHTYEGEFLFLFLGASVVNPAKEKVWVAKETKNFMADFILLRLN